MTPFAAMRLRQQASGGGADPDAHRYWRIHSAQTGYISVFELEFRTNLSGSTGITETATGGTAFADTYYAPEGLVPANAFNGTFSGLRYATNGSGGMNLGYDYGAGNEKNVVEVAIGYGGSGQDVTGTVDVQFSDNDSDWTTKASPNVGGHVPGQFAVYEL